MKLYVKKVWSWNPTKYRFIPYEKALKMYDDYIGSVYYSKHGGNPKGFESWLKTEI